MWNRVIKIPVATVTAQDAEGYPTRVTTYRTIKANFGSATRNDQVLAEQKGYSADVIATVLARNLTGIPQNWSEFTDLLTGDVYTLKRVYQADKSRLVELTGQLVRRGVTA